VVLKSYLYIGYIRYIRYIRFIAMPDSEMASRLGNVLYRIMIN